MTDKYDDQNYPAALAIKNGYLVETQEFNAVCDQLGRSENENERLRGQLETAEKVAFDLCVISGRLAAIVEWCVENDGETLSDNLRQLEYAKRVLAETRSKRDEFSARGHPS